MGARLVRTPLGYPNEEEITEQQALAELAAAQVLGPLFHDGDLETGLTLWTRGEGGMRIAPVRIWWQCDEEPLPPWHFRFFGQFAGSI